MSYKTLKERVRLEVKSRKSKKEKKTKEIDDSNLSGLYVRSKSDGKTWTVVGISNNGEEACFQLTAPGLPDENGTPGPTEKLTISKKDLKSKYELA